MEQVTTYDSIHCFFLLKHGSVSLSVVTTLWLFPESTIAGYVKPTPFKHKYYINKYVEILPEVDGLLYDGAMLVTTFLLFICNKVVFNISYPNYNNSQS